MNGRIVLAPQIHHGRPIIKGTRVPAVRVIGGLTGGMTTEEIMREYDIHREDVLAAVAYAAELIDATRSRHS